MSSPARRARPVETALTDWANDDLLISETARGSLRTQHPQMVDLLDWPALRALFQQHEGTANMEKRRAVTAGRRAVCFAFLAFTFTALSTVQVEAGASSVAAAWLWVTGLGATLFATICFAGGLNQMFHGGRKTRWMLARLWTETLRRFYFQFLIQNFPAALEVMAGTRPPAEWRALQAKALSILQNEEMQRPVDALRDILNDTAEEKVWVLTAWRAAAVLPAMAPSRELDQFFDVMERKRLQCQKDYSTRKLQGTRLALRGRAALIRTWFYFLVFIVLGLDAAAGLLRILNEAIPLPILVTLLAVSAAVASAGIVALQMWDRGEQISGETDRMEWYLAGVDSIHRRYQMSTDPVEKIRALAEMEALAYQEMRQFLVSVDRREFVAG